MRVYTGVFDHFVLAIFFIFFIFVHRNSHDAYVLNESSTPFTHGNTSNTTPLVKCLRTSNNFVKTNSDLSHSLRSIFSNFFLLRLPNRNKCGKKDSFDQFSIFPGSLAEISRASLFFFEKNSPLTTFLAHKRRLFKKVHRDFIFMISHE